MTARWWCLLAAAIAGCGPAPEVRPPATGGGSAEAGAVVFRRCAACHTIGEYAGDTDGPNLYGVFGAPVGERRPRFAYTAGLKGLGGIWDARRLDLWLTDPRRLVPDTSMGFAGLKRAQDRADVIAYLATQGPPR